MMRTTVLNYDELEMIFDAISSVKICLIGDVCLDAYWHADMKRSSLSRETPHYPLPVISETYSLGGAGNVAAAIVALQPANLLPLSVIGKDWRGLLLKQCFTELNISTTMLYESDRRITPAYCKPIRHGISNVVYEDPRIDFENFLPLDLKEEETLLTTLERLVDEVDMIVVSDQATPGVITENVRLLLAKLGQMGKKIVVDSRERIDLFQDVIIKPNEVEAVAAVDGMMPVSVSPENYHDIALQLAQKTNMPTIVTLGEQGSLWADKGQVYHAPTRPAEPPIDIVGAGDTFVSAFACAYGAGIPGEKAIAFANLAAAVTVKKIGTTGSANRDEIRRKHREMVL